MPSTVPYSLAFVGIILAASLAVLGQEDPCALKQSCQECVATKTNTTAVGNNGTCIYEQTSTGPRCSETFNGAEGIIQVIYQESGCLGIPTSTTVAPNTTTSTNPPPTPPTTNGTTPTPPPTPAPSTNGTTTSTTVPPTTNGTTTTTLGPSTNGTTTTAAPATTNGTTTVAPTPTPTPTPRSGGFAWGEFIGGIVFAVAISSLAYLIWRFYKARLDRNYHTFSNPTF